MLLLTRNCMAWGINLLGRPDIYDNLIRLKSVDVASELLTLDKDE